MGKVIAEASFKFLISRRECFRETDKMEKGLELVCFCG